LYGITIPDWASNSNKVAEIAENLELPVFQPKLGVKIITDDKVRSFHTPASDDPVDLEQLIKVLHDGACNLPPEFRLRPIQFEKVWPIIV
jgi:ubiquitin-activating enzyme E1